MFGIINNYFIYKVINDINKKKSVIRIELAT